MYLHSILPNEASFYLTKCIFILSYQMYLHSILPNVSSFYLTKWSFILYFQMYLHSIFPNVSSFYLSKCIFILSYQMYLHSILLNVSSFYLTKCILSIFISNEHEYKTLLNETIFFKCNRFFLETLHFFLHDRRTGGWPTVLRVIFIKSRQI